VVGVEVAQRYHRGTRVFLLLAQAGRRCRAPAWRMRGFSRNDDD